MDSFQAKMIIAGVNFPMEGVKASFVNDLPNNTIDSCYMGTKKISISLKYWKLFDEAHREQLMYHELGHCVLGRGHINEYQNNIPVSVMNMYHFSSDYYLNAYGDYMNELFQVNVPELAAMEFDDEIYGAASMAMGLVAHEHIDIQGSCGWKGK